jgi:hypothetical protein
MEASSEIPKIDKRLVRRNGATYEQDTGGIGNTHRERLRYGRQPDSVSLAEQYRQPPDHFKHDTVEPDRPQLLSGAIQFSGDAGLDIGLGANGQVKHQPERQDFECPRCGREKIVGVNGSRRWCLSCLAEWPTAAEFLAEVKASCDQVIQVPSRQHLNERFQNILARLNERDMQFIQINAWLNELESSLVFPIGTNPPEATIELTSSMASIPIMERA